MKNVPAFISMLCACILAGQAFAAEFQHFEARHVHPIALTPDGSRLLVVNSPDARLSVFNPSTSTPAMLAEIPVGLEPVSVRARTNDEAWVVGEVSDSVTIVSLASGTVIDVLRTADEPADVAFAAGKAFVSCSRAGVVRVFDAVTRADLGTLPLSGDSPRALGVNADGTKVYAAFQLSGNQTTVLPAAQAPDQPAPSNASLPAPPKTALIVDAADSRVHYTVLDHDIAEIDTASLTVTRYMGGAGTCLFDVVPRPGTDELWIPNTEALNRTRFEPVLNGHFAENRVTRLATSTEGVTAFDLNPGIDYSVLPNAAAQATALAQPTGIVFSADGTVAWVAAFGSDRVARVDPVTGTVNGRVDVRLGGPETQGMRGPRGIALDEAGQRLFVLNKLSNTVTVIDTASLAVVQELASGSRDPTPREIREGRGFLFDARVSGNGTMSCATCHLDADRDGLAWDLGNPAGDMVTALGENLVVEDDKTYGRAIHPMKGPMTTQTLRGMSGGAPFHWRGDKASLQSFNPTFHNLMGGSVRTGQEMDLLAGYLLTLAHHPNPNRNRDRTLPPNFNGGSPVRGKSLFDLHNNHCGVCHEGDRGSSNNIDLTQEVGGTQPVKSPSLRTVYQRTLFDPRNGHASISGFGLLHDGTAGGYTLPTAHPYVLDNFSTAADFADVAAYVLCFDTGTAPTVGFDAVVTASNKGDTGVLSSLSLLETRAQAGDCDLIVRGRIGGQQRSLLFGPSGYQFDKAASGTVGRAALLAMLTGPDGAAFMGVPPGMGAALSIDHDGDGVLDGDAAPGSPVIVRQPHDAALLPGGSAALSVEASGQALHYQWKLGNTGVGTDSATLNVAVAGTYTVIVSNTLGSTTSRAAVVTSATLPVITAHPAPLLVMPDQNATLSVAASGSGLRYQWLKNGAALIGATTATLTLHSPQPGDSGLYSVIVSNAAGSVTSHTAQLIVPTPPVMNALNLPDARAGEDYAFQLTARNNAASFSAAGLPAGLVLNSASGLITGHAFTTGQYLVVVSATNIAGTSPAVSGVLNVLPPAAGTAGSFQGVIARQAVLNDDLGGRITVTTASSGTFTGTLVLGLKSYPLTGRLASSSGTADSTARLTLTRAGQPSLQVSFTVTPATLALNGSLTDGTASASFTARQPSPQPASFAGNYTFAMLVKPAGQGNDLIPQGHSVGAFKIASTGVATGLFKLADGTVLTFSNTVEADGSMSQFKLLYANTGSLLGMLTLDSANGFTMGASQMSWFKKAQPSKSVTRSYKAGFASFDLETRGGRYAIPAKGVIPMGLSAGPGNAKMTFNGGGAPSPATRLDLSTLEIVAGSPAIARVAAPNPGIVTLTLTPGSGAVFTAGTTGSFTGSFMLLDADTTVQPNKPVTRTAAITGMIVNDGAAIRGYGFYLLPELPSLLPAKTTLGTSRVLSGSVTLEAAP